LVHPGPWRFLPTAYVALHIGQFKPKLFVPAWAIAATKEGGSGTI
jgi:hypothetical protein